VSNAATILDKVIRTFYLIDVWLIVVKYSGSLWSKRCEGENTGIHLGWKS